MLVKGPFTLKWGNNDILDVSEVTFNYEQETNDYDTVDGRRYQVEGVMTASVELTLLSSDIDALKVVVPQFYVAKGDKLSTGETVTADAGAIDFVAASCDTDRTSYDLEITACGADAEVTRLVNAHSNVSGIEIQDNQVRTVTVTFTGEPEQGQGILQFFKVGGISPEES